MVEELNVAIAGADAARLRALIARMVDGFHQQQT
jgi:hypothetical protein